MVDVTRGWGRGEGDGYLWWMLLGGKLSDINHLPFPSLPQVPRVGLAMCSGLGIALRSYPMLYDQREEYTGVISKNDA